MFTGIDRVVIEADQEKEKIVGIGSKQSEIIYFRDEDIPQVKL